MSLADVRSQLADAFADLPANVYAYPPKGVSVPAIVVEPDSPYLEPITIGAGVKVRARYAISVLVNLIDNQAALDALERLVIGIYESLPAGVTVGDTTDPVQADVNGTSYLLAVVRVSVITQQEN